MDRRQFIPLVGAALLTLGCGGAQTTNGTGADKPSMVLTPEGLMGLDPEQKIDATVIQKAFPELTVDTDGFGVRYAIRKEGATLALIEPTGAVGYRAKVLDASVAGPDGIRVGAPWTTIAELRDIQCRRGAGEWASQIYCTTPRFSGIVFGFDGATVDTGDCTESCTLPSTDGLAGHAIRMIDWERPLE